MDMVIYPCLNPVYTDVMPTKKIDTDKSPPTIMCFHFEHVEQNIMLHLMGPYLRLI